ncbi:hypothetical protein RB200_08435 [Streptomyces sp. PmtG]
MTSDFSGEHNVISLMGIVLIAVIAVVSLVAYAWVAVRGRGLTPGGALRAAAALSAAGAVGLYGKAATHLFGLDVTTRDQLCRDAVGAARAARVDAYEPTYFPLRFGCHVAGDGTYTAGVPGYLNPAAFWLAVGAVVLAAGAVLVSPGFRYACARGLRVRDRVSV